MKYRFTKASIGKLCLQIGRSKYLTNNFDISQRIVPKIPDADADANAKICTLYVI